MYFLPSTGGTCSSSSSYTNIDTKHFSCTYIEAQLLPLHQQQQLLLRLRLLQLLRLLLLLLPFYGHCTGQSTRASTPRYKLEDFVGAKFYCLLPLLMATSTFELGRRCRSSSQWCCLHRLRTNETHPSLKNHSTLWISLKSSLQVTSIQQLTMTDNNIITAVINVCDRQPQSSAVNKVTCSMSLHFV